MPRRPVVLTLILGAALLAACGEGVQGTGAETGIRGVVLAGPQCPVVQEGSPCPDVPMSGIEVQALQDGSVVRSARTDDEGRFELAVPPGAYVVEAVLESEGPPTAKPVEATVAADGFTEVTVLVDTGIR